MHQSALEEFSFQLRGTLEQILDDSLPDRSWDLAQLGIKSGGLGLRSAERHACAAYLASLTSCSDICTTIDQSFDRTDADEGLALRRTEQEVRDGILDTASLDAAGSGLTSQKWLSSLLDAASKDDMLRPSRNDLSFRAHVQLSSLPGAGVWLTAPPIDAREMDSPLFKTALKRRLRVPVFAADGFCPCCGNCLDRFGDHALVCPCKGDRTVRHNSIRNALHEDAVHAGLRPEKEKQGLLPNRPEEDGLRGVTGDRRPADVWLPRGANGRGQALDFACTSGLRTDLMQRVSETPNIVFEQYENLKRSFKDTARVCEEQGFEFIPMILEAHAGAWSPVARRIIDLVAKGQTATWNEPGNTSSLRIAQRLSTALHRDYARAILRRTVNPVSGMAVSGWDQDTVD